MKRKLVARTRPEEPLRVRALQAVRLVALITQTRGILRPTAHRELRQFAASAKNVDEISKLLAWGATVVEADFKERYSLMRPRTKIAVTDCPLPVFSQPNKAFKVRWMFRPRNRRAYIDRIRRSFSGPEWPDRRRERTDSGSKRSAR